MNSLLRPCHNKCKSHLAGIGAALLDSSAYEGVAELLVQPGQLEDLGADAVVEHWHLGLVQYFRLWTPLSNKEKLFMARFHSQIVN